MTIRKMIAINQTQEQSKGKFVKVSAGGQSFSAWLTGSLCSTLVVTVNQVICRCCV